MNPPNTYEDCKQGNLLSTKARISPWNILLLHPLSSMGNSAVFWALCALLSTHLCTPVLSSVHTLYASNFHNVSELYTLQFDDESLEFDVVDSTLADGPMVWLDFDVSTWRTLLNEHGKTN